MDNENETRDESVAVETDDATSLKEKIKSINFVKWGKRAAITCGAALVAAVALSVIKNNDTVEE